MKLLKEHINEKFQKEGDPVSDLGIGIFVKRQFTTRKDMYEWLSENLVPILDPNRKLDDILKDILDMPGETGSFLGTKYTDKLLKYTGEYFSLFNERFIHIHPGPFHYFLKNKYPHIRSWQVEGEGKYGKPKKLEERFKEDSDPINDLGIGLPIAIPLMIKNIFTLDIENPNIEHLSSSDNSNIQAIFNDGKTFSIEFYSNRYYTNSGEEVNKKKYAIKLLKESGLDQFIYSFPYKIEPPEKNYINDDQYSSWLFIFKVRKPYIKIFKQLEKQFNPPKLKKF